MTELTLPIIGYMRSPYKEKFGIPRQPNLVQVESYIEMVGPYNDLLAFEGIEEFSHLWLVFVFHETAGKGWSPLVCPPRLGGNAKKGVFATRATFRPNPIGLSVVQFKGVERRGEHLVIKIAGIDLLDGTPILDVKPYLPYADAVPNSLGGFADDAPETDMTVSFSDEALRFIQQQKQYPQLAVFIEKVLKQDPRPPYKKERDGEQSYGMTLYEFNIKWTVNDRHNHVVAVHGAK